MWEKLLQRLKRLSPNEMVLIGIVITLIILIFIRWEWIRDEASEAFLNFFGKRD